MYSDENEDYLPTGGYVIMGLTRVNRNVLLAKIRSNLAALFGLDRSYKADGGGSRGSSKSELTYTPLKQPKKQTASAKGT